MVVTFLTNEDKEQLLEQINSKASDPGLIELGNQAELASILNISLESGRIYHFTPVGPLGNVLGLNSSCFLFYTYLNDVPNIEIFNSSTLSLWSTDILGSHLTKMKEALTVIDNYPSTTSTNPVQNKVITGRINSVSENVTQLSSSITGLYEDLLYESGTWNGGNAWYTDSENYGNYRPYTSSGSYEKIGGYCTLQATVEKVEGWQTIYYNLPVPAAGYPGIDFTSDTYPDAITVVENPKGMTPYTYEISTGWHKNQPVVQIFCKEGGMSRGNGYSDTITFTLRYRYKL